MNKFEQRKKRSLRVRCSLSVSNKDLKCRLVVFRSNKHMYAQIINSQGNVVCSASTIKMDKAKVSLEFSRKVGHDIAVKASEKGIKEVYFDRGGYLYHGNVKALADGARESSLLKF